jgi:hypothetical protein
MNVFESLLPVPVLGVGEELLTILSLVIPLNGPISGSIRECALFTKLPCYEKCHFFCCRRFKPLSVSLPLRLPDVAGPLRSGKLLPRNQPIAWLYLDGKYR